MDKNNVHVNLVQILRVLEGPEYFNTNVSHFTHFLVRFVPFESELS